MFASVGVPLRPHDAVERDASLKEIADAASAWMSTLSLFTLGRRVDLLTAPSRVDTPPSCADIVVHVTTPPAHLPSCIGVDALGTRLGEVLRIIDMAACVGGPRVLNALWIPKDCRLLDCAFCDGVADHQVLVEVAVSAVQFRRMQMERGPPLDAAVLHAAIFRWQESKASHQYHVLREILTQYATGE
ncbi:hypothetical protein P43SY_000747 [Pythium insidiosum]|uniref:Uncharacterized protein n=1 Tax=Pythium insidiosum TaxID=114742 RepID=A0AAD5LQ48_PYTIN|nr:hypothetical protein P43SY_000747 [Pythium insidiosum]